MWITVTVAVTATVVTVETEVTVSAVLTVSGAGRRGAGTTNPGNHPGLRRFMPA